MSLFLFQDVLICYNFFFPEYSQQVFPKQGTTSFLATVVFPKEHPEKTAAILSSLNQAVGKLGRGAVIEGVHAEVRAAAIYQS